MENMKFNKVQRHK